MPIDSSQSMLEAVKYFRLVHLLCSNALRESLRFSRAKDEKVAVFVNAYPLITLFEILVDNVLWGGLTSLSFLR